MTLPDAKDKYGFSIQMDWNLEEMMAFLALLSGMYLCKIIFVLSFWYRFPHSFARRLWHSVGLLKKLWYNLSPAQVCWLGELFSPFLEALKGCKALLEVHTDKDTGEVLTKFGVKRTGFIPGCESELPPMCFHLNRFHFCSQGIYPKSEI